MQNIDVIVVVLFAVATVVALLVRKLLVPYKGEQTGLRDETLARVRRYLALVEETRLDRRRDTD